jgi:hypothetical protein
MEECLIKYCAMEDFINVHEKYLSIYFDLIALTIT